jgi:two-component system, OmpR family, response regulator
MATTVTESSHMAQRVLLVEDDEVFALVMQRTLAKNGYEVTLMHDAPGVETCVLSGAFDALIVDGNLPTGDGFDLCRKLRSRFSGIIMLLTGRDDDLDELMGLELGADDYVRKPAEPRLVLARLKAHLRRHARANTASANVSVLQFGEIEIDTERRELKRGGTPVVLTDAEFDLLVALASRAGEIVNRDTLFQGTRGVEYDGLDRSIDMRVSRLRKLLGDDPVQPRIIKTVRGRGYLFAR